MHPSAQDSATERAFGFDELFFSRTDSKGRIQAGNPVFQRVSGFDWAELDQKPHNVIRHPDMPKAVFWLLWDWLGANKAIGAYVKNKAKDGAHYWVFALAMPVPGGYLSVRLKPSSPLFFAVQPEYTQLREKERRENVAAEASGQLLLTRLAELGFPGYEDFMTAALTAELAARQEKLGEAPIAFLEDLEAAHKLAQAVERLTAEVIQLSNSDVFAPLNLQIQSEKIQGETGRSLAVVSAHFGKMSAEIRPEIERFRATSAKVHEALKRNRFLLSANHLLNEVLRFYQNESGGGAELEGLRALISRQREEAALAIGQACAAVSELEIRCEELRLSVAGIEIVRLTGKIEAASLSAPNEQLTTLLTELGRYREGLANRVREIHEKSSEIRARMEALA